MNSLETAKRLRRIIGQIDTAKKNSATSASQVMVVAVSKRQPVELMFEYERVCREIGYPVVFGENYVKEFKAKKEFLSADSVFHLIGHLQRNKVKEAVKLFDVIESVDSATLLEVLNAEAEKASKVQDIFLQVNISEDPAKKGFDENGLRKVMEKMDQYNKLRIKGLMTITRLYDNPEDARIDFRKMRGLREDLASVGAKASALKLSMGMSRDFQIAVEEGADIVRIGTAIFGPRD